MVSKRTSPSRAAWSSDWSAVWAIGLADGFTFQWRDGIQKHPAESASGIHSRPDVKRQVPVVGPRENVADHQRTERSSDVAPGVHGAGKSAGEFSTQVHGSSPSVGHSHVPSKTGHGDREHGEEGILNAGRERQANTGQGESSA